ncbi:uncharacterized protein LOC125608643 [Brassica napus]|uniref:uncharacterized protein LOC125608643 n=1 Tax=Brassica napus TaxID=3708 RepID=UPI002078DB13|nr:uncharacterized protein LOC125608643 [Brassica napus]
MFIKHVKVWEDPWILTVPSRPSIPVTPVMHPNMKVSDLINQTAKDWDVGLLENYVNLDDIPLIRITRNLARRNMRCDNYCPRCGELKESVTHAIFECPPALQAWTLSATPTSPEVFPVSSVYTNMDNLFGRKNSIIESEQDMDPFPWIIWYIRKARNDKLFRGIDRDPLELVRYAESECQAWFDANEVVQPVVQENNVVSPQLISLGNICLLDESWTASANLSGCGWVWMDSRGILSS